MGAVAGRIRASSDGCPARLVGRLRGGRRRWTHAFGVRLERGAVGYMDSRAGGERLRAWWASRSGPAELTYADMTDALYEVRGADALFSTSGSHGHR